MAGIIELYKAAIVRNNTSEVTRLVLRGLDINCRDSMRSTILHHAAIHNMSNMVKHLVDLGAVINSRDRHGCTPLHHALSEQATGTIERNIRTGFFQKNTKTLSGEYLDIEMQRLVEIEKIKLINCLVQLGADVNAKFYKNVTSLNEAIQQKNVRAVKILAELGLATNETEKWHDLTALFSAVNQGQKEIAKHLVRLGADVNATYCIASALHDAVRSGQNKAVEILLEHGADVNARQLAGITLASHALLTFFQERVKSGDMIDFGMITCLAHLGADLNQHFTKLFPIHEAVKLRKPEILNRLFMYGADIYSKSVGHTPIMLTVIDKELELLKQLVECGANINAKYNPYGYTMIEACRSGNAEMVEALVKNGFNLNDNNIIKSTTALYDIIILEQSDIPSMMKALKVLTRLGADLSIKSDYDTALLDAVERGDRNMVKILQKLGADVKMNRWEGFTLLCDLLSLIRFKNDNEYEGINMDMVRAFVEAGADINSGANIISPIVISVRQSDTKMVKTLVCLGADVDQGMEKECTPFHLASLLDNTDIAEYLIENGASANAEFKYGIEPLLEVLQRGKTEMVKCLLACGANPTIGYHYQKLSALQLAIQGADINMLKFLIKIGADLAEVSNTRMPHIEKNMQIIADEFKIDYPKAQPRSFTVVTESIALTVDADFVGLLLKLGANKSNRRNKVTLNEQSELVFLLQNIFNIAEFQYNPKDYWFSDLHAACVVGELDIVRLLLIAGSEPDEHDSLGQVPFESLPIADFVDYHTLNETRTTKKVIESFRHNSDPYVFSPDIKSLLSTPGLGDVRSISYRQSEDISEEVHRVVCMIVERFDTFNNMKLKSCGSAAEGTKVGLPDEMDFLAQIGELNISEQRRMKSAGNDYVYYSKESDNKFKEGSKVLHNLFTDELTYAVRRTEKLIRDAHTCMAIKPLTASCLVKDSKRKATTPLSIIWHDGPFHVPVSVDVVPSLHITNNWPKGGIQRTWLLSHKELCNHGYYLVPKPPHASSNLARQYNEKELRSLWKISFPHLETYHMQHLDSRIKDVYILAKCLRSPDVCRIMITDGDSWPKNSQKYITSYMLKMVFLKNVEWFLNSDMSLGEMVCKVYDGIEEGLSKGFIPLFFMPKVNSLGGHKLDVKKSAKVARIMKKFVHGLFLRDSHNDQHIIDDVEDIVIYQRKPTSVYKSVQIGP